MSRAVTTQVLELENYVNGAWRRATASEFADVTNPASAELLARTPLSSPADVDAAVEAASAAFPAWRRTPPGERIQYLFKLRNLLEENLEELSRIITTENGKTFAESKAEMRRAIENVEVACGIPMMMQGYNLEDVTPGVDEMQIHGDAAGDFDIFDRPAHLRLGLGKSFSVFGRDDARQFFQIFFEKISQLEEILNALAGRSAAPGGKRGGCRFDGGIHIGR